MTWKNVLVEEVVDDRCLLAEMTPELRTLYVIVYTILPSNGLAFASGMFVHNETQM